MFGKVKFGITLIPPGKDFENFTPNFLNQFDFIAYSETAEVLHVDQLTPGFCNSCLYIISLLALTDTNGTFAAVQDNALLYLQPGIV